MKPGDIVRGSGNFKGEEGIPLWNAESRECGHVSRSDIILLLSNEHSFLDDDDAYGMNKMYCTVLWREKICMVCRSFIEAVP